jgi:outer membrane protein TolC
VQGNIVTLNISFESFVEGLTNLDIEDKVRLWDILDEQIAEYQEQHPTFRAEVDQAHAEYRAGDYLTLDQLVAQQDDEDD